MDTHAHDHHFNATDSAGDFDCSMNHGSFGDVSIHIGTFHRGLLGGPIRERLDPTMLRFVHVTGTSVLLVMYEATTVGVAHVDQHGNLGAIEISPRFSEMVQRFGGKAAL